MKDRRNPGKRNTARDVSGINFIQEVFTYRDASCILP